ncbi:MAG TPA: HAD-IB family phosphatase [Gaiellales bacterium]|jgi:HAD superfamily phosphoserine phosphatase-like hydrolase|nr:HAD-IB family phosphatase [Gaiellales bacterium]
MSDRSLVVVDFDGTAHELDLLDAVCTRHAPAQTEAAEAALLAGRISLNECIRREFESIQAEHEKIVEECLAMGSLRTGFERFVAGARAAGHRVVIVSSGFHSIIGPILERAGLGDLEVFANDARFSLQGTQVSFRDGELCEHCGEPCKRPLVRRLNGREDVVYIGDGWSDRCASAAADRRFARRSLATYLDRAGLEYTRFDDFDEIARELLC